MTCKLACIFRSSILFCGLFGVMLVPHASLAAMVYHVGPGQAYTEIAQVRLDQLNPGDEIIIHGRAQPYRLGAKFTLNRSGTASAPIRIRGVEDNGYWPKLDGNGATEHPTSSCYLSSTQSSALIGIMQCPVTEGGTGIPPKYIEVSGLEIANAQNDYQYQSRKDGKWYNYFASAGVGIYHASHITIKNNDIHHNMNGIFMKRGYLAGQESKNNLFSANYLHHNGEPGNVHYHQYYGEGHQPVLEFNRVTDNLGSGAQIKTRDAEPIIRYNWIMADTPGKGSLVPLDIVDGELNIYDPNYGIVYVYGNVIVSHFDPMAKFIHMGFDGDPKNTQKVLHLFYNTFMSFNIQSDYVNKGCDYKGGSTKWYMYVLKIDPGAHVEASNNVFHHASLDPDKCYAARFYVRTGWSNTDIDFLSNNWILKYALPGSFKIKTFKNLLKGSDPGFQDYVNFDFRPKAGAPITNVGMPENSPLPVEWQPAPLPGQLGNWAWGWLWKARTTQRTVGAMEQ